MEKSKNYGSVDVEQENSITIQEAIEQVGFGKYQIQLYFVVGLVMGAEAMELMLLSILSPALECEWGISSLQQALLTTVVFVGMLCSCSLWGYFSDRFGRKTGLLSAVGFMLIFGLLSAVSPSYGWLLAFRGLAGCGIGALPLIPAIICEYLPIGFRGQGIVVLEIFWGLGSVFEVTLGLLVMDSLGWRAFVALSALPLGIFLIIAPIFMDESARFLVVSGQSVKARHVMEKVADKNGAILAQGSFVDESCLDRGNILELFSTNEMRRTTIVLSVLWFLHIFIYYGFVLLATELYASDDPCKGGIKDNSSTANVSCGLTQSDYVSLLWSSAAEIPGALIILFPINRIGRKKTLSGCLFLTGCTIAILLACLESIPMTIVISVTRGFAFATVVVVFIYTPEVYPTRIRAIGSGTCSGVGRVGAAVSPFLAQVAASVSLDIPIILYSLLSFVGAVFAMFLPIETMGIDRG